MESDVPHLPHEMEVMLAFPGHDVDTDRRTVDAVHHDSVVPAVEEDSDLPRLRDEEGAVENGQGFARTISFSK